MLQEAGESEVGRLCNRTRPTSGNLAAPPSDRQFGFATIFHTLPSWDRLLMPANETIQNLDLDEYKYDFVTETEPVFRAEKGLSEDVVRLIST